jgi:hypothetical protein
MRLISTSFTLDSRAEVNRSRSAAHSSRTENHWPCTDVFHLVNICARESDSEGEEADDELWWWKVIEVPVYRSQGEWVCG